MSVSLIINFNPIIVLFLTVTSSLANVGKANFNPIIVLFLTLYLIVAYYLNVFQSYYSLISNVALNSASQSPNTYFNPIIVLFLTQSAGEKLKKVSEFQSYYSLISNRPHFFSKRAKTIYNLFIHTLKFVDNKKCFLFICINKQI